MRKQRDIVADPAFHTDAHPGMNRRASADDRAFADGRMGADRGFRTDDNRRVDARRGVDRRGVRVGDSVEVLHDFGEGHERIANANQRAAIDRNRRVHDGGGSVRIVPRGHVFFVFDEGNVAGTGFV